MKRKCAKCGQEKELNKNNFYKAQRNAFGFHLQCKECMVKYQIANNKKKIDFTKLFIG